MARPPGADHARWGSLDDRFDRGQRKGTSPPRPKKQKRAKAAKAPKVPKARKSPGHTSRMSSLLSGPKLRRPPALDDPYISRGMANGCFQQRSSSNIHPQQSERATGDLEANIPNNFEGRSSTSCFSVEAKWITAVLTIASGTSGIAATAIQITYGYMQISSPGTGVWILFSFIGFVVFGFWCSEIRVRQARNKSINITQPSPDQQRNERPSNERSQGSIHELIELSPRGMTHHHTHIQLPAKVYKPESRSVNPGQASQDEFRDLIHRSHASDANLFNTFQTHEEGPSNTRNRSGISRDFFLSSRHGQDQENSFLERSRIPRSVAQSNFGNLYHEEDEREEAFQYDLPSRQLRLPIPFVDETHRNLENYSISPSHSNNDLHSAAENIGQPPAATLRGRTPRLDPDILADLDAREQRLYFEQARGAFSTHGDSDDSNKLILDDMLYRPKSAVRAAEVPVALDDMSPIMRSPHHGFPHLRRRPVSLDVIAKENVDNVEEAAEDVQIVLQERRSALERLSGHSTPPLIHGPPSNDDLADLERLRELRNAEQSVTVPLVLGFQRQRAISRGSPSMSTSHSRVGRGRRGEFVAQGTRSRSRNTNVDSAAMQREFEMVNREFEIANRDFQIAPPTPRFPNAPTEEPQDHENWI